VLVCFKISRQATGGRKTGRRPRPKDKRPADWRGVRQPAGLLFKRVLLPEIRPVIFKADYVLSTTFSYDAPGFLTKKLTGVRKQTFIFDNSTGNLMSRGYRIGTAADSLSESFTYDNLDRLISSTAAGQSPINITYADNGNILTKTGVGNYAYLMDKINAVKDITNNPGSISTPT